MGNRERAKVDHVIKKKNTPIFLIYIANFLAIIFLYGKMIKYKKKNKVIIIIIGKKNHNRHFVNNY